MREHVVFLLHGIRTQGEWEQRAAAALETDPTIRVRPIRYEFLDIFSFLIPLRFIRNRPVRRIAGLIRDERLKGATKISIVAHSFGTYIVSVLLAEELDLDFYRLILCGSIIPDNFEWAQFRHRLHDIDTDWQLVNDCGMRDIWPVMAKSVTWGYGSSGRFGFGHGRVKDCFFSIGHSDFFGDDFVNTYWLPYLSKGQIVEGVLTRPTTSWWVSVLTVLKIRYMVLAIVGLSVLLFLPALISRNTPLGSGPVSLPAGTPSDLSDRGATANQELAHTNDRSYSHTRGEVPLVLPSLATFKIANLGYFARHYDYNNADELFEGIARYYSPTQTHTNLTWIVETYSELIASSKSEATTFLKEKAKEFQAGSKERLVISEILDSEEGLVKARLLLFPTFDMVISNPNHEAIVLNSVEAHVSRVRCEGGDVGIVPTGGVIPSVGTFRIKIPSFDDETTDRLLVKPIQVDADIEPMVIPAEGFLRFQIVLDMSEACPGQLAMRLTFDFSGDASLNTDEFVIVL